VAARAQPAAPATAPDKLRVVVLPHLTSGPQYLARELGLFAARGLEVELVKLERSTGAVPLLLNGDLDVLTPAPGPALFHAIAAGERLRVVAAQSIHKPGGCGNHGLVARTGVELEPGARGLRVSANRSLMGGYLLERLLAARGIDPSAQQYVNLSAPAEMAAFLEGQLDAAVLNDPWLRRAQDAGAARLVVEIRDLLPGLSGGVVVFGPRLLADRELGQRYFDALLLAIAEYQKGPTPRNLEIFSRAFDLEPDLLARSCWPRMVSNGELDFAPLEAYQRWEVERGSLDRVVTPAEYWDGGFVERAARSRAHGPG
jgi:NitT/TauT family transport system substrate-binding protein